MPNTIFMWNDAFKDTFKHLFQRNPSKNDLRKMGNLAHLTTSDAERGYKFQKEFGEIKCQKCKKVADSFKKKGGE